MRDLAVLFLHLLTPPPGWPVPAVPVPWSRSLLLVKQQLLIPTVLGNGHPVFASPITSSRGSVPSTRAPGGSLRSAIVLKPSTLFSLHRALTKRKYRRLFSSDVHAKPGPKGPSQEVVTAVIDMKRRNPTWGCPRIAQQITGHFW